MARAITDFGGLCKGKTLVITAVAAVGALPLLVGCAIVDIARRAGTGPDMEPALCGGAIFMPTLTLFFAAAAALVNMWLGMRCGQVRMAEKINHGDGGNQLLQRRMRAQLNFAENTPIILILFGALELAGASDTVLMIVAPLYIVARICHALGMDADSSKLRMIGVLVTMLMTVGLALFAVWTGYSILEATDMPAEVGTTV